VRGEGLMNPRDRIRFAELAADAAKLALIWTAALALLFFQG
jgi:hypothetical protein